MASIWATMPARKTTVALHIATTMNAVPIIRFLDPYLACVITAFEGELVAKTSLLTGLDFDLFVTMHYVDNRTPRTTFTC